MGSAGILDTPISAACRVMLSGSTKAADGELMERLLQGVELEEGNIRQNRSRKNTFVGFFFLSSVAAAHSLSLFRLRCRMEAGPLGTTGSHSAPAHPQFGGGVCLGGWRPLESSAGSHPLGTQIVFFGCRKQPSYTPSSLYSLPLFSPSLSLYIFFYSFCPSVLLSLRFLFH